MVLFSPLAVSPKAARPSSPIALAALAGLALLGGGSALSQTPIPPSAKDFAAGAVQTDRYEELAAQTALAQSRNREVRAFAEEMIVDHHRTTAEVLKAAAASGLKPPPLSLSSDGAALLAALQGQRGKAFDQAYAKQQVLVHTEALAVEQSYASGGADANLRQAASAAVPLIRRHLQMAQQLRSATSGS